MTSPLIAGFCQCGCGGETGFAEQSDTKRGYAKGDRLRFLPAHTQRRTGTEARHWRGGRIISAGYVFIKTPGHPRASTYGDYVPEHILVAEAAIGKYLPFGIEVHHVDENKSNNQNDNLVICPDHAYHVLLHKRMRALKECGHANWLKCRRCKKYDAPKGLVPRKNGAKYLVHTHAACERADGKKRHAAKLAKQATEK